MSRLRTALSVALLSLGLASCTEPVHDEHDEHAGHDHGAHDEHAGEGEGDAHEGGGHADEVTLSEAGVRRAGIRVGKAEKVVLLPTVEAPARVSFDVEAMAHVGTLVPGRVTELRVRRGDHVKKGDVLLVVDSPELGESQSDFLQKRIAAEAALPAVELFRSSFDRAKRLYDESRGITLTELQRREGELRTAEGGAATARAAVTAAENRLHLYGMIQAEVEELVRTREVNPRARVVAPIDGEVVDREVTQGELVGPDREALLVLADTTTLWVLADVPENRLAEIVVGTRARVLAGASGSAAVEGAVSYVAPQVDPATRAAQVRIVVRDGESGLRPGMFAQVELTPPADRAPPPVVAVPEEAVQNVEGEPSVFVPVEGEPNTFAKRAVTVGRAVSGMVPVHSGLAEGEAVVVAGSFVLKADLGKSGAAHEH